MEAGVIPPRAQADALHIAIAARWRIDFLLTWNCRHINNAVTIRDIEAACRHADFVCPVVCTPKELMGKVTES